MCIDLVVQLDLVHHLKQKVTLALLHFYFKAHAEESVNATDVVVQLPSVAFNGCHFTKATSLF